jgi:hypothetical protein
MKYKIRIIFILIGVLIVLSCSSKQIIVPDKSEQHRLALMMEALEGFISNTPYCALIQYTGVDVVPIPDPDPNDDDVEEKHIYHAKVLETFHGQQMQNISYIETTAKGEGAHVSAEPTIITLCIKNNEFFWVGTGSEYPATKEVIKAARRISQKVKSGKQSFSFCE